MALQHQQQKSHLHNNIIYVTSKMKTIVLGDGRIYSTENALEKLPSQQEILIQLNIVRRI